MVEISRSRIIRITNYSARVYTQVQLHTHTHVYIGVKETAAAAICDDDVMEMEVESKKTRTQSSIESFFAPLPAGQVQSPRPRSKVRLGQPRTPSIRPVGRPRKHPPLPSESEDELNPKPKKTRVTVSARTRSPTRRQYESCDMLQKRLVAAYAKENTVAVAARKFRLADSTVRGWMKIDFERLEESGKRLKTTKRAAGGGRKITYSTEADEEILTWVLNKRDQQQPVTIELLQAQGRKLIVPHKPEFVASRGWARHFMKRHMLVLRMKTSLSQRLPANLEERLGMFLGNICRVRQEHQIPLHQIGNMDETPAYFDICPNRTIAKKGEKSIIVRTTGAEKRHLTVVLSCSANGGLLPPMIVFKGKRALKGIVAPPGFIVTVQEKAWMNEELTLQYIRDIWEPNMGPGSLLVWDSFRAHITDTVSAELKRLRIQSVVIPGGCTSKSQPLDVSLNKPFKGILRNCWVEYIADQVQAMCDADRVKTASKQIVVDWIVRAWTYLKERQELIKKSFLVTGISCAMDGTQDYLCHNDSTLASVRHEIEEYAHLTEEVDELQLDFFSDDED